MCAASSYEPHTALVRVATAIGHNGPRHGLAGRWGARAMLKTNGAYMTKESHNNWKLYIWTDKVVIEHGNLFCINKLDDHDWPQILCRKGQQY
jgi:hypothetical protein